MEINRPTFSDIRDLLNPQIHASLEAIKNGARDSAVDSGLPGHISGPNDALRHMIGAAEAVRQHGEIGAGVDHE